MQAATSAFPLDARLLADTRPILDLPLCRVLLMNDARWPWIILVPRRTGLVELFDLDETDRRTLFDEASAASKALAEATGAEKINVGALGNVVRQFHLHLVARSVDDPNWPRPVWGFETARPYAPRQAEALISALLKDLA